MKQLTRARAIGLVFLASVAFVTIAYASFVYNTRRFIENPELLGIPTVYVSTVEPVFVVVTQDPAYFDNGLDDDDWGTPFPSLTDP